MGKTQFDFEGGGVVMDDSFSPVLITTWWGTANIESVDEVFRWSDARLQEAIRRGDKIVLISDALDVQRPPPTVRRYMAERSEEQRTDERDAATLLNLVVVGSAAIRGALTAIGWFSSKPNNIVAVKDMATAIERAATALEKAGIAVPLGLDRASYRRPVPDDRRVSSG